MSLTNIEMRATKPGLKPFKLSDGGWLYLLVSPSGSKLWRMAYRFEGKEKVLSLGGYLELSLKDARTKRDEAKALLASGTDPSQQRKVDKLAKAVSNATTFRGIAEEYLEKQKREGRASATLNKTEWLLSQVNPKLGDWPITSIKAPDVLAVLKTIEARGNLETANRLRSTIGAIFRYAIATARAESDPTGALKSAIRAAKVKNRAAILDPVTLGGLLRAFEGFDGQPATKAALRLLPLVFIWSRASYWTGLA
jgi:Arm DNA-binding domain